MTVRTRTKFVLGLGAVALGRRRRPGSGGSRHRSTADHGWGCAAPAHGQGRGLLPVPAADRLDHTWRDADDQRQELRRHAQRRRPRWSRCGPRPRHRPVRSGCSTTAWASRSPARAPGPRAARSTAPRSSASSCPARWRPSRSTSASSTSGGYGGTTVRARTELDGQPVATSIVHADRFRGGQPPVAGRRGPVRQAGPERRPLDAEGCLLAPGRRQGDARSAGRPRPAVGHEGHGVPAHRLHRVHRLR